MIVEVNSCARCGGNHPVDFNKFSENPVVVENIKFKYWGLCPNNKEPILMKTDDLDDIDDVIFMTENVIVTYKINFVE